MGFFSFFSKEKKETLDKGLSKTKESVFSKIARAVAGKSKVDDEVLDNLEEVLITSDVGKDNFEYYQTHRKTCSCRQICEYSGVESHTA